MPPIAHACELFATPLGPDVLTCAATAGVAPAELAENVAVPSMITPRLMQRDVAKAPQASTACLYKHVGTAVHGAEGNRETPVGQIGLAIANQR